LLLIERYAKQVMRPAEAARCRQRHLRVIYRFLLYWRATGRGQLAERELERLAQHGAAPSLADYRDAVLEWPAAPTPQAAAAAQDGEGHGGAGLWTREFSA
jgi:hypothetical protein